MKHNTASRPSVTRGAGRVRTVATKAFFGRKTATKEPEVEEEAPAAKPKR